MLAQRHNVSLRVEKGLFASVGTARIGTKLLVLAIPTTYMNESGRAAVALARRYEIDPEQLLVVHDELDLPPAVVRLKAGGGLAGNNGLRSIKAHCKTEAFLRVRIGIGKPVSKERGADHVLTRFSKVERAEMDAAIETAADAVEVVLGEGIENAMLRFHTRPS